MTRKVLNNERHLELDPLLTFLKVPSLHSCHLLSHLAFTVFPLDPYKIFPQVPMLYAYVATI